MLKYMLTTKCNRKCFYCIIRNVHVPDCTDLIAIERKLKELRKEQEDIMITGGEPSLAEYFFERVLMAKKIFKRVYLTTQKEEVLSMRIPQVTAITFSLHDIGKTGKIPEVKTTTKVYGSILDNQYYPGLSKELQEKNYSGLTINEKQREGKEFIQELPQLEGFSIKVNRRGKCIYDTILFPNLRVVKDFTPYL